jgi:hypothetical protein
MKPACLWLIKIELMSKNDSTNKRSIFKALDTHNGYLLSPPVQHPFSHLVVDSLLVFLEI